MAHSTLKHKLHGLSKSERLCNFTLKQILFNEGHQLNMYPLKIFWKVLDKNLETLFFPHTPFSFAENIVSNPALNEQNPSRPHQKIPVNALFPFPAKCLIGVSGKVHKRAVRRNHFKRLLREAYRQNKQEFYSFLEHAGFLCILGIVYTGKEELTYPELQNKIIVSLQKIQEKINAADIACK